MGEKHPPTPFALRLELLKYNIENWIVNVEVRCGVVLNSKGTITRAFDGFF